MVEGTKCFSFKMIMGIRLRNMQWVPEPLSPQSLGSPHVRIFRRAEWGQIRKKSKMIYEACIIEAEWVATVDRRKWRLYIGVIKWWFPIRLRNKIDIMKGKLIRQRQVMVIGTLTWLLWLFLFLFSVTVGHEHGGSILILFGLWTSNQLT